MQNLSKNSLIITIGSGINQFLVLLVGLFSARYLGPNQYGIIALASSLNIIFIFFISFGLHHYITREIAKDTSISGYFYSGIIWLKIILFIPLIVSVYCFMVIFGYNSLIINITLLTTISFIINNFVYGFYAVIQGYNDMKFIALGYSANGFLIFFGILYFILERSSIYAFVLVPLFSNILVLIYVLSVVNIKYKLRFLRIFMIEEFLKRHFFQALPFGITGLFVTFYMWSGSFWISIFYNEELVGYFNAAFRIVVATFIVSQGVNMSIYPILSNQFYQKDRNAIKYLFHNQLKILSFASILIAFIFFFLANFIIQIFLGPQFTKSIPILQIMVFIIPLVFIRSSYERLLEITGHQIQVTISYGIGSLIGLLLDIVFIYYFSIIGAAFALMLTDFTIFCLDFYQFKKINFIS